METNKIIGHLEEIIEDLKKAKKGEAEVYIAENFKTLLDGTTIRLHINWLGDILSMCIPYDCDLAKKLDEACGEHWRVGISFKYGEYDLWINKENQTWRLRVGPFPEKYPKRLEFIKKYVLNFDTSSIDHHIEVIKLNIKRDQEKIEKYEKALKEISK